MSLVSGETAYISTEQHGSSRRRVCANTFSLQCVTISFYSRRGDTTVGTSRMDSLSPAKGDDRSSWLNYIGLFFFLFARDRFFEKYRLSIRLVAFQTNEMSDFDGKKYSSY